MKVFFLTPYPIGESPSQRFRFEQYFSILESRGYSYNIQTFHDSNTWRLFFERGHFFSKLSALFKGTCRRLWVVTKLKTTDFVFIHRELLPFGPPLLEWVIAKVLRKKIIYDFDDAIWLTDRPDETWWFRQLKWRKKVGLICRWSFRVSCGNHYLALFAEQFNSRVVVNPTTIETDNLHNPAQVKQKDFSDTCVIGWTGSHSTMKYLEQLGPVLSELEREYANVRVMVIADRKPDLPVKNLVFRPWRIGTEMSDLAEFDIGVMPLPEDEWTKGKGGFKALQYMALEIPAVVSPVGVNLQIVEEGKNGLFAITPDQWRSQLRRLIENPHLRKTLGTKGRDTVVNRYSVRSNAGLFLSLFE
jgi:glycosyltransferase involved in cell wall biosynthesis